MISESQVEYAKLKEEINFLSNPSGDENRLRQIELEIDQEKIQKEQERARHEQWLEERKKKQIEIEKQLRPNYRGPPKTPKSASESETEQMLLLTPTTPTTPGTSASPLLTSLLKSSSEASPTRSAPTITNLLTSGSSHPSTQIISQPSPSIITASPHLVVQNNANINHIASQIPASLTAPTLITLLDKKVLSSTSHSTVDKQLIQSVGSSKDATHDATKDEDADLLAGFSEVLVKLDDDDLADLDAIIMNPEILDAKLVNEDEQSKDEDSMHATTNDDYDKLKIKQLVEDFTTVEPVVDQKMPTEMETDVIHPPSSDIENSNPASIEVPDQNPNESNDSKQDEPAEEKVVIISDESSNTNDEKPNDDLESQTSAAEEDSKEVPETSEHSGESKEPPSGPVFHVEDSDDDATFEDAKEILDNSGKASDDRQESNEELKHDTEPEKSDKDIKEEKIIDSDDETLGVKASRGGRRKATDTRSRDHSNDDNRDATPIRTRSRHSSVIEPKSTFNFTKEQDHSMWKARWDDCVKEMQKLKDYSSIIDKRVIPDDSCKSYILRPMNMNMIGKNIENHYSTTSNDVKRDFGLMCTNIVMYPNREKVFIEKVQQFLKDAMEVIESNMEVEDAYKSYRKQIRKKHN